MANLTPAEVAYLRFMLRQRGRPLTFAGLVAANRARYAFLFATVAAGAAALFLVFESARPGRGPVGAMMMGMLLLGALSRDVGIFRRSVKLWPVSEAVTDWERVEEMVADAGAMAADDGA